MTTPTPQIPDARKSLRPQGVNFIFWNKAKTVAAFGLFATALATGVAFSNCSGFRVSQTNVSAGELTATLGVNRMAIQNPIAVKVHGCNAPTWNQIPDHPDYFVGRLRASASASDLETCAGTEVYTLALGKMNWATNEIKFISTLLDLSQSPKIQSGKYMLTTAYDPSVTFDGTEDWLAFECYGTGFTGTAASCMAPFSLKGDVGAIDLARAYVPVLGGATDPLSPYLFSASVPKLLYDSHSRLYLYWSVVQINKTTGIWSSVTTRGIELQKNSSGQWAPLGYGIEMPADNPASVEVFGTEALPQMNVTADSYQVTQFNGSYFLIGSSGNCTFPDEAAAGCYRMTIRKSATPLGTHIFNASRMPEHLLPSNSIQYFRFYKKPSDGVIRVMGLFANSFAVSNQMAQGFYSMDLDPTSNFFDSTKPLGTDPIAAPLRQAYKVFLMREPTDAELEKWGGLFYRGMTDSAFLNNLINSPEAVATDQAEMSSPANFIKYAWQATLGHAPDDNSLSVLTLALQASTTTPSGIVLNLSQSAEFVSRYPYLVPMYK